ncbi:unnamed protein product [Angiostrongylus costaricensis]|uniref:Uncharacterized protein n=1 Tax=Angiostrongylus costaricensis TaxID=334426 RepID=A0A0R3PH70_ANGCS|nr:unnamed protein product [Angiostrongylus costaricensis]
MNTKSIWLNISMILRGHLCSEHDSVSIRSGLIHPRAHWIRELGVELEFMTMFAELHGPRFAFVVRNGLYNCLRNRFSHGFYPFCSIGYTSIQRDRFMTEYRLDASGCYNSRLLSLFAAYTVMIVLKPNSGRVSDFAFDHTDYFTP